MSFRGHKAATKDIDVILDSPEEAQALEDALRSLDYRNPSRIDRTYRRMGARGVMENTDGFRWDIFVQELIGFRFSQRMRSRSEPWLEHQGLTVLAAASEDIFAFKALTDRPRDREDMDILFASGLDVAAIREEVEAQAENPSGKRFAAFFYLGLRDFVDRYGVRYPDLRHFERLYEREMAAELILAWLDNGPQGLRSLSERLDLPEERVRAAAERLSRQGLAIVAGGRVHGADAG